MRKVSALRARLDASILKFATVGALTTAIDFAIFAALTKLLGAPPAGANLVSYSSGVATSFVLNRSWTFRSNGHAGRQALQFVATNFVGLTLSTGLVGLFALFLPDLVAKTASVPIVFLWNYLSARLWVFRH